MSWTERSLPPYSRAVLYDNTKNNTAKIHNYANCTNSWVSSRDISTNFEGHAAIRLTAVCLCADSKYKNLSLFNFDPLP